MILDEREMAKMMRVFGKEQRTIQPVVRKAPKYRRLSGEAKKQIFMDMDLGVSLKHRVIVMNQTCRIR